MAARTSSILKLDRVRPGLDFPSAIEKVRQATGKGAVRQAYEIARNALGPQRFSPTEYYSEGLWRTELSAEDRDSLISSRYSTALNRKLSPFGGSGLHGLLTDKLLTGLTLRAAGFPAMKPCAIFGRRQRLSGVESLASAEDIVAFLRRDGSLPVFGKPLHASLSIGAGSYLALAEGGNALVLGDGRVVDLRALAEEIAANFARGYVFEPVIRQHPEVERIAGPAVGCLRIVTVRNPEDVEVLYALQRLPAVGAMMDAAHHTNPYTTLHIDAGTGRVIRAQAMDPDSEEALVCSLVTGARFDTVVLPFMAEAQAMALDVHRLLERPGLLGFDIALTPTGPLITEINNNPFHTSYQHAAKRGFLNRDFRPKLERALAAVRADGLNS